jgi:molybdenum cofactor cytidylyltransferase
MPETVAIILAAGLSRRMGARNKLLLPIQGIPMIRHMVATYHAATGQPVCVVTGHEADRVSGALEGAPVTLFYNADYATGQATSVAVGLQAVPPCDRMLMGLGDQPQITSADIVALLAAHDRGDPTRISIPGEADRRGNPIVIPYGLRAKLLADPRAPGCKKFTRAHPEHVQFHPLPNVGLYADVDTPAAYDALIRSTNEVIL